MGHGICVPPNYTGASPWFPGPCQYLGFDENADAIFITTVNHLIDWTI